jgi:hypothetical protein
MALGMAIPSATYSLDGKETTAEMGGGMPPGTTTLKAKLAKDRKALELSAVRHLDIQGNRVTITSKERWKLAEGGAVLSLQRTVETPGGTDTVKLTLIKEK